METTIRLQEEFLAQRIFFIRGKKVMFDFDLARLYEIETRVLKQQVRRNSERFPDDFMFQLSDYETDIMVSQFVIPSKRSLGGARPMAFTEQGVAMLSSVLRSKRAILVNIAIMRAFVNLRQLIDTNKDLLTRIDSLEEKYDQKFLLVFEAIKELIREENQPREAIGYKIPGGA
ncbi:MAG: ORF6N domain-containing protein [bacterium]